VSEGKGQFATVELAQLRGLIAGISPTMFVTIKVGDLNALLNQLDKVEELEGKLEELLHETQRLLFEGRRIEALVARGDASECEDEPA
jgi:hypothetical protein